MIATQQKYPNQDARYAGRPGEISPLITGHGLVPGDELDCKTIPVAWRRGQCHIQGLGI